MRILNHADFLKVPDGTVFQRYEPVVFHDLCIKAETIGTDFLYQSLGEALDLDDNEYLISQSHRRVSLEKELSLDFDCGSRDGMFGGLYAVWSDEEVDAMIEKILTVRKTWRK